MAIIVGGDAGIVQGTYFGFVTEIKNKISEFADIVKGEWDGGIPIEPKERVFVDDGFSNVPGTSFVDSKIDNVDDIQTRRITSQEPSLTVYIKKRAFWGLSSANDSRFMDSGEKLFMRASKILFEKKCNQIAAYEALTKVSKLVSEDAHLDAEKIDFLIEVIRELKDGMQGAYDSLESDALSAITQGSLDPDSLANIINTFEDELKKLQSEEDELDSFLINLEELVVKQKKLTQATNTNWVVDPDDPDTFFMGRGAGVIELTLVSSADTSLGLESPGSVNLTVEDPYNLMKITTDDVEVSLAAANAEQNNLLQKDSSGQYAVLRGPGQILEEARSQEEQLRSIRENRVSSFFGTDRTAIGNSELVEIIFELRPASYAADKVVAYTSSSAALAYNLENLQIAMLQMPIEQQLTMEEAELVKSIFELLNQYVEAVERLNAEIEDLNSGEDVTYARRQLRMHYLGKSIVQPMDSIHIYIRGNTYTDGEIVGPLSGVLNNSTFIQNYARDRDVSDAMLKAEMEMFDLDIDVDFYKSIRTSSFMRNAGMHVFGGLVRGVSESYNASNGTYILNVSGQSNLRWLELSRVNTAPSLEQPQGMLEDPLTPFSFKTDPATGLLEPGGAELLPGNAEAIANKKIRDKTGTSKGKLLNSENHAQDLVLIEGNLEPIFQHTPGLVYKWKPGVMVASLDVNLKKTLKGEEAQDKSLQRYVGVKTVNDPFVGLDAADIVSMLVTGYPHSAQRFYASASSVGTFSPSGSNSSTSYFHSFFDITRSTNKALGNFKPFRAVKLDGTKMAKQMALQGTLYKSYEALDKLRSDLAKEQDKLNLINSEYIGRAEVDDPDAEARQSNEKVTIDIIKDLKEKIRKERIRIQEVQKQAEDDGVIQDTSNIVFDLRGRPSGIENEAAKEQSHTVRLRNKVLQFRPQFDCKFNQDENLLIISDEYDTNLNIQAFVIKLLQGDQQLFKSEFKYPREICKQVADILNFEFFCDTQGHLQFRPQQYNRIPLSLILKMFMLNEKNGIQLYPDFLKHLFESRLAANEDELTVLAHQIKRHALLLSLQNTDFDSVKKIVTDGTTQDPVEDKLFVDSEYIIKMNEFDKKVETIIERVDR